MDFFDKFKRKVEKMENIISKPVTPRWGLSSGNFALNRILSGAYGFGKIQGPYMQGKMNMLCGLSGVGKSFLLSASVNNALKEDFLVLYMDTENALDVSYLKKAGIDANNDKFIYLGVTTVNDVVKIVSNFVEGYRKEYDADLINAPKVLILLDSLSYLMTDSELNNFESGEQKGDQGQQAKQNGSMLRSIQHAIKPLNITFISTNHVYENPNVINGKGKFLLSDKIKFPQTFIAILEKKPLKEGLGVKAQTKGFLMNAKTYKSRLNVLNASADIEVPWDKGMSPYSGVKDVLLGDKLIEEYNTQKFVITKTKNLAEPIIIQKGEFENWLEEDPERLKSICFDYDNQLEKDEITANDLSNNANSDFNDENLEE